jgi:Holliday junction DNA helicase RuvB
MPKNDDILSARPATDETSRLESALRPSSLDEFVGQARLKENLKVFIQAARQRREPLDHCLFYSPPGLGKTTLSHILAREMGVNMKVTSGPVLSKPGDLAAMLTTELAEGDILFIDEIHRLNAAVEEALYPVMEDFLFFINTGQGPGATTLKLAVPRFTLVGATTRSGLLTGPLRDRFASPSWAVSMRRPIPPPFWTRLRLSRRVAVRRTMHAWRSWVRSLSRSSTPCRPDV